MSLSVERDDGLTRVRVMDEMTIYTAAELKQPLLACLDGGPRLAVDLSAVAEMDTAGLQLLILLKREAARKGIVAEFHSHSSAVASVIELCNLAADFGDPIVLPAGQGD